LVSSSFLWTAGCESERSASETSTADQAKQLAPVENASADALQLVTLEITGMS